MMDKQAQAEWEKRAKKKIEGMKPPLGSRNENHRAVVSLIFIFARAVWAAIFTREPYGVCEVLMAGGYYERAAQCYADVEIRIE